MDADVLIVGAGPTGLMLATQLRRLGLRTIVVERNAGPARETRALGVQARTLEIYAQLGIAERAIALGKIGTGAHLWSQGKPMARVPLGDAGRDLSPYPYILVLGQDDNEKLLGEALRQHGGDIRWNTTLVSLQQHPDHVIAVVRDTAGVEQALRVRWVGGCDGAHSAVRHLSGIDFPGAPYEHAFFVADVQCRGSMAADEVNVYLWRSGFHLLFPMRGENHWRIVGILPRGLNAQQSARFEDVAPDIARQVGGQFRVETCTWFSTYRIHHRRAEHFAEGRCFLLGDAAHIHSPVGAQGMNTGLQDAWNLAWKLALVARGQAVESLLETYHEERSVIAQKLLDSTDRGFRIVVSDSAVAGLLRTRVLARVASLLMRWPRFQRMAFRTVSQIGVHYRWSSLSREVGALPKGAPRPGDRFPWMHVQLTEATAPIDLFSRFEGLRHVLLLFGQPAPESLRKTDFVDVLHVPDSTFNSTERERVGLPSKCFFLLRPDGYIGCSGVTFDERAMRDYASIARLILTTFDRSAASSSASAA